MRGEKEGHDARVSIESYADNEIVVEAETDSDTQFVLMENYFRDWTATVNGRPQRILPAYGVFRSVLLGPGQNRVVLRFRPAYLVYSLWLSAIGGLLFLAAGALVAGKPRNPKGATAVQATAA